MNEDTMLALIRPAMTDRTIVPTTLNIFQAWCLHSGLTLAAKHPHMGNVQRGLMRDIAWVFQKAIIAVHPEAKPAFKSGVTQAEFERFSHDAMADETPLTVNLTISKLWFIVTAVQAVDRHPQVERQMLHLLKSLAMEFQERIEDVHPNVTQVLNRGWDSAYDVEAD